MWTLWSVGGSEHLESKSRRLSDKRRATDLRALRGQGLPDGRLRADPCLAAAPSAPVEVQQNGPERLRTRRTGSSWRKFWRTGHEFLGS